MNPLLDALLQRYETRISAAGQFALQYRVVLLEAANGIPLDVATVNYQLSIVRRKFAAA
jgi:hypothetical protein